MRILVIEDNHRLNGSLASSLTHEGYSVDSAYDGQEGQDLAEMTAYDLIILDILLPKKDGLEVCRNLRRRRIHTPILLLTARDAIDDRVQGLDCGADDYLVKPFAFAELLARIRALLRRGKAEPALRLSCDELEIDMVTRAVTRSGQPLDLTAREFDLLEYLLRNQGRVVSREMLAHEIWKETARHTPLDNVIDVHIARLRRKVDDPFAKKLLHTVRGVGFVLREETQ